MRFLRRARQELIRKGDPLVTYYLNGVRLLMPISHDLPFILREWPTYGRNLVRIAAVFREHNPGMAFIDIGANIGDTAAMLHGFVDCPILCVEGNPRFLPILAANLRARGGEVELDPVFVTDTPGTLRAEIETERGTARIRRGLGRTYPSKTLAEILQHHPRFAKWTFLKLDTDGMDCLILESAVDVLAEYHPIVFFEYDPRLYLTGEHVFAVFRSLREAGYRRALIYTNLGEYLLSLDLRQQTILYDLHSACGGTSLSYLDICVLHATDKELANELRSSEVKKS